MKNVSFGKTIILAIILVVTNSSVYCQTSNFHFDNISINDGLADGNVTTILQDAKGFIWIGTTSGLTRYDGYSCITYKHKNNDPYSLSANVITAMCIDNSGALWIGTVNGLNRFDERNDRFDVFYLDSSYEISQPGNFITTLAKDSGHKLWIGTKGDGLKVIITSKKKEDNTTYEFIDYGELDSVSGISNEYIKSICIDKVGNLWILNDDGLYLLQKSSKRFVQIYCKSCGPKSMDFNKVASKIYADKDGTIWMFGAGMLDKIRLTSNAYTFSTFKQDFLPELKRHGISVQRIRDFIIDKDGGAWIASYDQGFIKFEYKRNGKLNFSKQLRNRQVNYSIPISNVLSLYEDRSGNIWIGTEGGVSKYRVTTKFEEGYFLDKVLPAGLHVFSVLSDKQNRIWINSDSVLFVGTRAKHNLYSVQTIPLPKMRLRKSTYSVNVMYQSRAGDIYLGTNYEGLFIIPKSLYKVYDPLKWTHITDMGNYGYILPSNNIVSICEDSVGAILISMDNHLCRFDPTNKQIKVEYTVPDNSIITSLCVDDKGGIWCGTSNGVYLIKGETGIETYKNDEKDSTSLSNGSVTVCYMDHNKNIWIGTENGLNYYNRQYKNFKRFTIENSLFDNNTIQWLQEDAKGNLWIATRYGLVKYDGQKKRFFNYKVEHNVESNIIKRSASKDTAGVLYFNTLYGITSFNPGNIKLNEHKPPIVITNIKVFNTSIISVGDTTLINTYRRENKLVLKHNQHFFTIEFAALNYINSSANQYAYKLIPLDKQWNYVGNRRFANYTNVSPGNYVFTVMASNNDGVWNEVPATINIIVTPPWYRTWWAYTMYAVVVSAVIYLIYRIRLQQEVIKMHKLRSSIARDLHDDVGSALSSIALLTSIAQEGKTNTRLKPEEVMARIGGTSKRMIDLMDDIVWTINPSNDRFKNMLIRMKEYAAEMLEAKDISFIFKIADDVNELKIPMKIRKDYFLIFKEAVNNLAKYSQCRHATIAIHHTNHTIITTITDDGKGFDQQVVCSGNGLKNMQERADNLKGKLHIETERGRGTTVALIVPVP